MSKRTKIVLWLACSCVIGIAGISQLPTVGEQLNLSGPGGSTYFIQFNQAGQNPIAYYVGSGSPQGAVSANAGSIYIDLSVAHLWFKQNGTGNTGWYEPLMGLYGSGSPNGSVTGNIGDLYVNQSGGSGTTLYVKESGNGTNSGWVGK